MCKWGIIPSGSIEWPSIVCVEKNKGKEMHIWFYLDDFEPGEFNAVFFYEPLQRNMHERTALSYHMTTALPLNWTVA
jgi:hypothetical protein